MIHTNTDVLHNARLTSCCEKARPGFRKCCPSSGSTGTPSAPCPPPIAPTCPESRPQSCPPTRSRWWSAMRPEASPPRDPAPPWPDDTGRLRTLRKHRKRKREGWIKYSEMISDGLNTKLDSRLYSGVESDPPFCVVPLEVNSVLQALWVLVNSDMNLMKSSLPFTL